MAFHWHGDIFDLPRGATPLATFADELQSAGIDGSAIKLNSRAYLPTLQKKSARPSFNDGLTCFSESLDYRRRWKFGFIPCP